LGKIGKGEPHVIDYLIKKLHHSNANVRHAAWSALVDCDGEVCGCEQEIRDLILSAEHQGVWNQIEYKLLLVASPCRSLPDVRAHIIELAKPKPPRIVHIEYGQGETYPVDEAMQERSVAISALAYFAEYADECIDVLRNALDDFEETDPDENSLGPHGRVCTVIKAWGPVAGPLAKPLAEHLPRVSHDNPTTIIRALAAIGPTGADAIPLLIPYREASWCFDDPLPDLDAPSIGALDDPFGWLIQHMRGQV
jgi:hypothetical protein